jgi:hypothetical protein
MSAAVRRTTAITLMALALAGAGATAAEAGEPPSLDDCYTVSVTDPTTGQHPSVDVCPPV